MGKYSRNFQSDKVESVDLYNTNLNDKTSLSEVVTICKWLANQADLSAVDLGMNPLDRLDVNYLVMIFNIFTAKNTISLGLSDTNLHKWNYDRLSVLFCMIPTLEGLNLAGNALHDMDKKEFALLFAAIRYSHISKLNMDMNFKVPTNQSRDSIKIICDCLNNSSITYLSMRLSNFAKLEEESFKALCSAITNPKIRELYLYEIDLTQFNSWQLEIFSNAIANSQLEKLHLPPVNNYTSHQLNIISIGINKNRSLIHIDDFTNQFEIFRDVVNRNKQLLHKKWQEEYEKGRKSEWDIVIPMRNGRLYHPATGGFFFSPKSKEDSIPETRFSPSL